MSEEIQSYRDLKIWQNAMSLAEARYRVTRKFPLDEIFGMTSQIRRSASSIAANIAEGHGRESTGSFIQYLRIAQGSLKELETHLLLAQRVQLVSPETTEPMLADCQKLGRMVRALIRQLEKKLR